MNWFERYSIIGAYFIGFLAIILYFNGYFKSTFNIEAKEIFFTIFAIFPTGYILAIISQLFYYRGLNGTMIHKEVLKRLDQENRIKFNDISYCDDEALTEVKFTAKFRSNHRSETIESHKYLDLFNTKRWDVVAINSALKLATLILFLIYLPLKYLKNFNFCFSFPEIFLILILILLILCINILNRIFSEQMINIILMKAKEYKR